MRIIRIVRIREVESYLLAVAAFEVLGLSIH